MSNLNSVTDSSFDEDVLQSSLPVLVDYWAEWCRPCQMLTPILEEVSETYKEKVKIVKMNVDQNTAIPAKFGIRGIPTVILFKSGKVAATKSGFMNKSQMTDFLNSHL